MLTPAGVIDLLVSFVSSVRAEVLAMRNLSTGLLALAATVRLTRGFYVFRGVRVVATLRAKPEFLGDL
jgi:hypothetical protein